MLPVDPPSIHPGKTASDDVLDRPRLCSALMRFGYPSCSEDGEAIMKQADFPGLVRFVTLTWTLGQILIIVGHPTYWNPVFRPSCRLRTDTEIKGQDLFYDNFGYTLQGPEWYVSLFIRGPKEKRIQWFQ